MLLKDPRIIDTFSEQSAFEPAQEVSAYDKARIESALSALTAREKEIFILHKVEQFSYRADCRHARHQKVYCSNQCETGAAEIAKQIEKPLDCMA